MDLLAENFDRLVAGAVRAPSGDNTQPWKVEVDLEGMRLTIRVDSTRDTSPMNAGQRMARIAVGAAVENVARLAQGCGLDPQVVIADHGVTLQFDERAKTTAIPDDQAVIKRTTNRYAYQQDAVSEDDLRFLSGATQAGNALHVDWITRQAQVDSWARLIGVADAELFSMRETRAAFLANIRFDLPFDQPADEGLGLATLGASRLEVTGLRLMRTMPELLFKLLQIGRQFGRNAARLVKSASGLCVISSEANSIHDDYQVGRAMQRAWLALTDLGWAAQPMMSLAVLENLATHGDERDQARAHAALMRIGRSSELYPRPGGRRVAFILRFGRARKESPLTGRRVCRPVEACSRLAVVL